MGNLREGVGQARSRSRANRFLQPAGQQQDDQDQKNEPAQTPSDSRAAEVKTASAKEQQQDYQHNQ
jgi:hypothetical protein